MPFQVLELHWPHGCIGNGQTLKKRKRKESYLFQTNTNMCLHYGIYRYNTKDPFPLQIAPQSFVSKTEVSSNFFSYIYVSCSCLHSPAHCCLVLYAYISNTRCPKVSSCSRQLDSQIQVVHAYKINQFNPCYRCHKAHTWIPGLLNQLLNLFSLLLDSLLICSCCLLMLLILLQAILLLKAVKPAIAQYKPIIFQNSCQVCKGIPFLSKYFPYQQNTILYHF